MKMINFPFHPFHDNYEPRFFHQLRRSLLGRLESAQMAVLQSDTHILLSFRSFRSVKLSHGTLWLPIEVGGLILSQSLGLSPRIDHLDQQLTSKRQTPRFCESGSQESILSCNWCKALIFTSETRFNITSLVQALVTLFTVYHLDPISPNWHP
jgi:hypothetical protein